MKAETTAPASSASGSQMQPHPGPTAQPMGRTVPCGPKGPPWPKGACAPPGRLPEERSASSSDSRTSGSMTGSSRLAGGFT